MKIKKPLIMYYTLLDSKVFYTRSNKGRLYHVHMFNKRKYSIEGLLKKYKL